MSFERIMIELPPLPEGPSLDEDEMCFVLKGLVDSPVVRSGLFGAGEAHPSMAAADSALSSARTRLAELEAFGHTVLFNMGQAWLEGGAPGRPGMKEEVDARLDRERQRYEASFRLLLARRDSALRQAEDRDRTILAEGQRIKRRVNRNLLLLDLVEAAQSRLSAEGAFRALDLLDALPAQMVQGVPRRDLQRLGAWISNLRQQLVLEREEMLLEEVKLKTQRFQNVREGVGAETSVLGKVQRLQSAREQNLGALDDFMRTLGNQLLPLVTSFANGLETESLLRRAKEMHGATSARVELLERVRRELRAGP